MTIRLLPEFVMLFLLVFARTGTMVMLLPGFGEQAAPAQTRLLLALFITLLVLPLVRASFPPFGNSPVLMVRLLLTELMIGLTFGLAGRFIMSILQTAGVLVSQEMGLSFTMTLDPTGGDRGQAAAISGFLTMLGVLLILTGNLHHVAIIGMIGSYQTLVPGGAPPSGDALELGLMVASSAFATAVKISSPFIVFALVFNIGLGILSRMMPQLQIFFLAMPAMILLGTLILILVLGLMMDGFLAEATRIYGELFPGAG